MLMLSPRLWHYTVDGSPPALCDLDVSSIDPGGVMLLDSWFCVVVHTGAHLAAWRNQVRARSVPTASPRLKLSALTLNPH